MPRRLLIACAMAKEAEALRKRLPGTEVLTTGLGIKRTLPTLLSAFGESRPDVLVFTGSVGQLDLRLQMSDVVLTSTWCFEKGTPCFDVDAGLLEELTDLGWDWGHTGLTLPKPAMKERERRETHVATGAAVYDSVTAAVLRVCETEGVPCLTPKIVASTVDSGLMGFWQKLDQNISPLAETLSTIMKQLGASPAR